MANLPSIDEIEAKTLAPYAQFSSRTLGRVHHEDSHFMRSEFQRDRDRIIHSSSFRRLEYKTQVFIYHFDDNFRTRLTHTIEVAQIARSITKILQLNIEVAEAIALAHDLGHPPFGHNGEEVLNRLMGEEGFEHNEHTLRIVETLEKRYPDFNGLNLTFEVKEGLAKHGALFQLPKDLDRSGFRQPTLEAQVVDISDAIAYNSHDLDDGISSKMIDMRQLDEVRLWRENRERVEKANPGIDETILKYQIIRSIINEQVTDLVNTSFSRIKDFGITDVSDVRKHESRIISFSDSMTGKHKELKLFLRKNLYSNELIRKMEFKTRNVIQRLFEAYDNNPEFLPEKELEIARQVGKKRVICDYIAGMTDRFAIDSYRRIYDPSVF